MTVSFFFDHFVAQIVFELHGNAAVVKRFEAESLGLVGRAEMPVAQKSDAVDAQVLGCGVGLGKAANHLFENQNFAQHKEKCGHNGGKADAQKSAGDGDHGGFRGRGRV
jgi:hypothetical protein